MLLRGFVALGLLFASPAMAQNLMKLKAGMVTGIDQIGLPIALERGFFEKQGLDVEIARPYATGVDALNALQAGESEIVQVGVPMIGAVLRGMDLVALGNYSGNATKLGSDATMALIASEWSGIRKGDLASLKGKKIAASFGTINHLYILALLEKAGLTPARRDARQHAAAGHDGGAPVEGHRRLLGLGPLADRGAEGRARRGRGHPRRRRDLATSASTSACGPGSRRTARPIEKFLAAVSEADKWMRANPKQAAQVATRWIPGLKADVAEAAMQFNIQQADRRLSANNYRALWSAEDRLQPARLHQIDLRREQAHRAEAHPRRDAEAPGPLLRPAADPGRRGDRAGIRVQALGSKKRLEVAKLVSRPPRRTPACAKLRDIGKCSDRSSGNEHALCR